MYKEERIIDGVMCYRTSPDEKFKPYTIKELSNLYEHQKNLYYKLLKQKEKESE